MCHVCVYGNRKCPWQLTWILLQYMLKMYILFCFLTITEEMKMDQIYAVFKRFEPIKKFIPNIEL